jgi:hypothetical protein
MVCPPVPPVDRPPEKPAVLPLPDAPATPAEPPFRATRPPLPRAIAPPVSATAPANKVDPELEPHAAQATSVKIAVGPRRLTILKV